jgi:hypothetical protein
MRIASRVVGVALALAGLVFLVLSVVILVTFHPESVLEEPQLGRRLTGGLSGMVVGVGFILAGWYFFRLDVDKLDQVNDQRASRFAPYFLAHRRELKLIAQIGLVISLVRFAAACFGRDWPGRWSTWALVLVWIGLLVIGRQIAKPPTMDLDWQTIPERLRPVLKATVNVGRAAFVILLLAFVWNQWSHHQASPRVVNNGFLLLFFAWDSLFFAYGEVRTDREAS